MALTTEEQREKLIEIVAAAIHSLRMNRLAPFGDEIARSVEDRVGVDIEGYLSARRNTERRGRGRNI